VLVACGFAAPAHAVSLEGPAGRVTVTERTQVELRVKLIHKAGETARTILDETLEGMAGDPLEVTAEPVVARQPVELGLTFVARADQDDGLLPVRVVSRVIDPDRGRLLGKLRRTMKLPDGRLRLVDLWSSRQARERLVLALTATWKQVPRAVPVSPEAHPVDLVVEVLREGRQGARELLERHRLSTLIGSPVSYTFTRRPRGATAAKAGPAEEEAATPGQLRIEVLPDRLHEDEVGLSIGIRHEGEDIYSDLSSLDLRVRHEVGPGFSVKVPLPDTEGGPTLLFRVTPYF
jgi:hypothetical protein